MSDSANRIAGLRSRIAALERQRGGDTPARAAAPAPFGVAAIDAATGGGLARGRLHELFAASLDDASAASGFAAMLAARLGGGAIVWLREERAQRLGGALHAPGLADLGVDPGRVILGVLDDPLALLRAANDVARCPRVAVAVVELWRHPRPLDLTASRRLAVAAEQAGVTVLMLRTEAEPSPSAAQTRWRVAAAAAAALEADAPGLPTLELTLLRQRGGAAGMEWQVEWDRDQAIFREPALSGAVVPLFERGSVAAGKRRAAC